MRREATLPKRGECPHRELPLPTPTPAAGSKGRAVGESHGLPSGGSPAGCSAGTSRIASLCVFAYLFSFGTALSPPPQPQVPPRGPAERGAVPRASRGGCADAEGAREMPSALPPALSR